MQNSRPAHFIPQVHRLTKSVVDIHVMVLQADGGELAVATTCASMALADAGIELYDLVTSCSVGYSGKQVTLFDKRQAMTFAHTAHFCQQQSKHHDAGIHSTHHCISYFV